MFDQNYFKIQILTQSCHFFQRVNFDWNKTFQLCMLKQTKTCHFGYLQSEIVFLHGPTEPPRVVVSIFSAPSHTMELLMWNIFPTVQLKVSDKEMYGRLVLTRRLPRPPRKQGHSGDCRIHYVHHFLSRWAGTAQFGGCSRGKSGTQRASLRKHFGGGRGQCWTHSKYSILFLC